MDFKRGVKESTFTDINAIENIYTTGGTMRDYCALGILLLEGGKSKGTGKNHVVNEPHGSGKTTQNKNHATEGVHTKPADSGHKAVSSDNKGGHVDEPTPKTKPKGEKPKEKKLDGNDDDHGGHLIGAQFDGSPKKDNLVPMNKDVNNYHSGEWGQMEKKWATELKNGKQVDVKIEPIYSNNTNRPSGFKVTENIDGVSKK